jgi:hypothetical protein
VQFLLNPPCHTRMEAKRKALEGIVSKPAPAPQAPQPLPLRRSKSDAYPGQYADAAPGEQKAKDGVQQQEKVRG